MKKYDVIVIGSGAGSIIVDAAVSQGLKTALVDKGPLGGTCLNVGCIPSKMLIYPADRIMEIMEVEKLGIKAEIKSIDFSAIMERMRTLVLRNRAMIRKSTENAANLDFFEGEGHFIDDQTLVVGGEKIKGNKIFIASGARVLIPPIKGINDVNFLTNESLLELKERPDSLIIIGGGYIAAEYGHFFAAMGTDVSILQRESRLVQGEEPEISALLKKELEKRMAVELNIEATEVKKNGESIIVVGTDLKTGKDREFSAKRIMIAAGRRSNADLLKVENTGVKTDEKGFIIVNDFLETSKKNIWAFGDAIGREMFRHVANDEAETAWHNSVYEKRVKMDYSAVPHAVFSHPQIASVGLKETEAIKKHSILVGKAKYTDVAIGLAMMENEGFAKAIVDKETMKILGFHIIGPYAPILIQEVVNAMANKHDIYTLGKAMHIHPALPELVMASLSRLEEPPKNIG